MAQYQQPVIANQQSIAAAMETYSNLKREVCMLNVSIEQFKFLKTYFKDFINSNRTFDKIKNLDILLSVLEKRDHINERNVSSLHEIKKYVNGAEPEIPRPLLSMTYENYRPNSLMGVQERKICDLLCDQMGKKWVDFARNLHVPEAVIDELDKKHSMSECIRRTFQHGYNYDPRTWKSRIKEALMEARRRDLAIKVDEMLDITDFSVCYV